MAQGQQLVGWLALGQHQIWTKVGIWATTCWMVGIGQQNFEVWLGLGQQNFEVWLALGHQLVRWLANMVLALCPLFDK